MKTIRVGSRESRLAVVQSELVMDAIRAAHPDPAALHINEPADNVCQRRLAAAGGAQHADQLSGLDGQAHVVECGRGGAGEALGDVDEFHGGGGRGLHCAPVEMGLVKGDEEGLLDSYPITTR